MASMVPAGLPNLRGIREGEGYIYICAKQYVMWGFIGPLLWVVVDAIINIWGIWDR